mmetsp:Transcript_20274/g.42535  ORF Transcript_20274/g.42535 Transcript_20274/m.42535 type:complete len:214 (-) Transcript_20274:100-741(-)
MTVIVVFITILFDRIFSKRLPLPLPGTQKGLEKQSKVIQKTGRGRSEYRGSEGHATRFVVVAFGYSDRQTFFVSFLLSVDVVVPVIVPWWLWLWLWLWRWRWLTSFARGFLSRSTFSFPFRFPSRPHATSPFLFLLAECLFQIRRQTNDPSRQTLPPRLRVVVVVAVVVEVSTEKFPRQTGGVSFSNGFGTLPCFLEAAKAEGFVKVGFGGRW